MEILMEKLIELEQNFNQMRSDVNSVKHDLSDIKSALLGNEFNENGFVQRVIIAEGKLSGLEIYVASEKERVKEREDREKRWALYAGIGIFIITLISVFWSFNSKK